MMFRPNNGDEKNGRAEQVCCLEFPWRAVVSGDFNSTWS